MLLKNEGKKDAVLGCGQYNLVVKIGEIKEIPDTFTEAFQARFPDLKKVEDKPVEFDFGKKTKDDKKRKVVKDA